MYLLALLLVELVMQSQACVQRGQTCPQLCVFLTHTLQTLLKHLLLLSETQHLKTHTHTHTQLKYDNKVMSPLTYCHFCLVSQPVWRGTEKVSSLA